MKTKLIAILIATSAGALLALSSVEAFGQRYDTEPVVIVPAVQTGTASVSWQLVLVREAAGSSYSESKYATVRINEDLEVFSRSASTRRSSLTLLEVFMEGNDASPMLTIQCSRSDTVGVSLLTMANVFDRGVQVELPGCRAVWERRMEGAGTLRVPVVGSEHMPGLSWSGVALLGSTRLRDSNYSDYARRADWIVQKVSDAFQSLHQGTYANQLPNVSTGPKMKAHVFHTFGYDSSYFHKILWEVVATGTHLDWQSGAEFTGSCLMSELYLGNDWVKSRALDGRTIWTESSCLQ